MIRVKEKQMKEHNADAQIRMYNERTIFMEFTTLSNGIKAPLLGVGTFLLSLEETEKSVYEAIRLGYRMIDTAEAPGSRLCRPALHPSAGRQFYRGLSAAGKGL